MLLLETEFTGTFGPGNLLLFDVAMIKFSGMGVLFKVEKSVNKTAVREREGEGEYESVRIGTLLYLI